MAFFSEDLGDSRHAALAAILVRRHVQLCRDMNWFVTRARSSWGKEYERLMRETKDVEGVAEVFNWYEARAREGKGAVRGLPVLNSGARFRQFFGRAQEKMREEGRSPLAKFNRFGRRPNGLPPVSAWQEARGDRSDEFLRSAMGPAADLLWPWFSEDELLGAVTVTVDGLVGLQVRVMRHWEGQTGGPFLLSSPEAGGPPSLRLADAIVRRYYYGDYMTEFVAPWWGRVHAMLTRRGGAPANPFNWAFHGEAQDFRFRPTGHQWARQCGFGPKTWDTLARKVDQ